MNPYLIIAIGTLVVLVCIIKFKLHSVISLLLAALVKSVLTSADLIYKYDIYKELYTEEAVAL